MWDWAEQKLLFTRKCMPGIENLPQNLQLGTSKDPGESITMSLLNGH